PGPAPAARGVRGPPPPPCPALRARRYAEAGELAIHEVRRAAIQEAGAGDRGPGNDPVENFTPEEGPHRRPVHQEVLDALRPELVSVTLPEGARQREGNRDGPDR